MDSHIFVDDADFYRVGTGRPLLPLPLRNFPLMIPNEDFHRLSDFVFNVIRSEDSLRLVPPTYKICLRGMNKNQERRRTVLIFAERDPGHDWPSFARRLFAQLSAKEEAWSEFCIELIDPRYRENPRGVPIPWDDPFLPAWKNLRPAILAQLHHLPDFVLSAVRFGTHAEDPVANPIGIFVSTSNAIDEQAVVDLRRNIELECRRAGWDEDVDVRVTVENIFVEGDSFSEIDSEVGPVVPMGASIGLDNGSEQVATLGGGIYVDHGSGQGEIQLGITNHHVVCASGQSLFEDVRDTTLVSPTHSDVRLWSEVAEDSLRSISKHLQNLEIQKELSEASGVPFSKEPALEQQRRMKATLDAEVEKYKQDTRFGRVYHSPGLKVSSDGWLLDYAAILPEHGRSIQNTIPKRKSTEGFPISSSECMQRSADLSLFTGLDSIPGGNTFMMIGRSSGAVIGRANAITADIKINDIPTTGNAWLVLPLRWTDDFNNPGDSGAFIFSIFGKVIGLFFGKQGCIAAGLVTPFEPIVKDLEAAANIRVVRPELD
ncbi:hypothetical protein BDY21DRAFT_370412 [Lineolata rhizophorae]|uniref:Uncharacterized protein n=1 Tax=Lineolata rhizophorae TaxID=578093 RepID=A0A6A6P4G9_9PEZI|nr:hypothetical protein BDY21DRAFT_370412 [Lineolata rhizophorae]